VKNIDRRNIYRKAALGLARRGFRVFPVRRYAKNKPLLAGWPERASSDPAVVDAWWRSRGWHRANVAVATGGDARLLVVDIDPDAGGKVELTAGAGEQSLPETVVVETPRGGWHFWFRVPPGRPLPRNSAGSRLGPGIDIRGQGGYALAPPSLVTGERASGRRYVGEYRWHPDSANSIATAPAWLLDALERAGGNGRTDPDEWLELVTGGVEEGRRNQTIAKIAGLLFRRMPREAELAAELLACWNQQRCRPPLEADELRTVLDSIADRERRRRSEP
jgi:hypothetical protein